MCECVCLIVIVLIVGVAAFFALRDMPQQMDLLSDKELEWAIRQIELQQTDVWPHSHTFAIKLLLFLIGISVAVLLLAGVASVVSIL